jgi:hypothetical protein
MARVRYNPREIDPNVQIEDGIRETLRNSPTAAVSVSVIESYYDLLDEGIEPISGTLEDKCKAIAQIVGAHFSFVEKNVVFKKNSAR